MGEPIKFSQEQIASIKATAQQYMEMPEEPTSAEVWIRRISFQCDEILTEIKAINDALKCANRKG